MTMQLNAFETDCLLEAVHYYVMHMRDLKATTSENYVAISNIYKFLIDADWIDMKVSNLPF